MARTAKEFVEQHTAEIKPVIKEGVLAEWAANRSGRKEDFDRKAELEKKKVKIYGRADEFEEVTGFHKAVASISDPLVARQVELIYLSYRGAQDKKKLLSKIIETQNSIAQQFNSFRGEYKGEKRSNNFLEDLLIESNDSNEVKAAWEARKQVGVSTAPALRDLAILRNEHAQSLGCADYYKFMLEQSEMECSQLFTILEEVEKMTDPLFREFKENLDTRLAGEFKIAKADLRPWHYRNPFFQELPPEPGLTLDPIFADKNLEKITEDYYVGQGLPIRDMLEQSDLYEREGKCQHAFCISPDAPSDVRVLCNIRPNERWMSTMLHEFGHAVYDRNYDPQMAYLLRCPAHQFTTEAYAMLNERIMRSADFLSDVVGVERAKAEEIERKIANHNGRRLLIFARWALVMAYFERGLYEDPKQDLNALWWKTVERFQWVKAPERLACPDWATKQHFVDAPVYYHNYLLGEMFASQVMAMLRREIGPQGKIVGNKAVGTILKERIFRPGATKRWDAFVETATGKPFSAECFMKDLSA